MGRIVVLNGPSSAGKSTLARALLALLGPTATHVYVDRLFAFLHDDASRNWVAFAALTDATFRSAAAFADGGYDVIVDTVFERRECLDLARLALGDRPYHLVGVTAPIHVLEAREAARGNRPIGLARRQHDSVLHDALYEFVLDTDASSTAECVERLSALIRPV